MDGRLERVSGAVFWSREKQQAVAAFGAVGGDRAAAAVALH
jgi:hypothetical protein